MRALESGSEDWVGVQRFGKHVAGLVEHIHVSKSPGEIDGELSQCAERHAAGRTTSTKALRSSRSWLRPSRAVVDAGSMASA